MRDIRPEPPTAIEPVLERFDYNRIGNSWAVVRLVARLREEIGLPTAPELVIEGDAHAMAHRFPGRACSVDRRLEGEPASLLWRAVFAVPAAVLEQPGMRFALCEAGAPLLALPAPAVRSITRRRLVLRATVAPQPGLLAYGHLRRRATAVAALAALTTTSTPAVAFASGASSQTGTDPVVSGNSTTPTRGVSAAGASAMPRPASSGAAARGTTASTSRSTRTRTRTRTSSSTTGTTTATGAATATTQTTTTPSTVPTTPTATVPTTPTTPTATVPTTPTTPTTPTATVPTTPTTPTATTPATPTTHPTTRPTTPTATTTTVAAPTVPAPAPTTPAPAATTTASTTPTAPVTPVLATDPHARHLAPAKVTRLSSTGHDRRRPTTPRSHCTPAGSRGGAAASGTMLGSGTVRGSGTALGSGTVRGSGSLTKTTGCTTTTRTPPAPAHWREPTAAEGRAAARRVAIQRAATTERAAERATKTRESAAKRRLAIMRAGIRQAQANERELAAQLPAARENPAARGVPLLSSEPGFRGPASWTGIVSSSRALTGVVRNLSGLLANGNRPPSFLIPIYMQAARRYHVPWEVLAAINAIESDYGRDLNTSSAGAIGWMQFEPSTWHEYGVAADGHSTPNPYDPRDAIFSAARYLAAAGAREDVRRAVYAYNHADWYVDEVMQRARAIATHAQFESAQTMRRGTVSVAFATGLEHHPRVTYRGGVMSHYDRLIATANMVSAADFPYLWGGGHEQPARFGPFDCSGSVSYVMQQAGYRVPTTVAADVGSWDLPAGPGRVTIFYNAVHTFMRIGHRYFGTSGFARPGGGAGWFDVNRLPVSYLSTFHEVHVPRLGVDSFAPNLQLAFRTVPSARSRERAAARSAELAFDRGRLSAIALRRALAHPLRPEPLASAPHALPVKYRLR